MKARDHTDLYLLVPTSPFRRASSIRRACEHYLTQDADSLVSVVCFDHPPQWPLTLRGEWVIPMYPENHDRPRRELPPAVRHDGGHLIKKLSILVALERFTGPKTVPYYPSVPPEESVDCNEPMDLLWAEFLLEKGIVT